MVTLILKVQDLLWSKGKDWTVCKDRLLRIQWFTSVMKCIGSTPYILKCDTAAPDRFGASHNNAPFSLWPLTQSKCPLLYYFNTASTGSTQACIHRREKVSPSVTHAPGLTASCCTVIYSSIKRQCCLWIPT